MIVFFSAGPVRGRVVAVTLAVLIGILPAAFAPAGELADTVARIKPSVVGVGSHHPTRAPQSQLFGTGFVVGDGYHVVTNAHVADARDKFSDTERLVVFVGRGVKPEIRKAVVVKQDAAHDLALLKISGAKLAPLTIGDSDAVREGESYAFTGFPIGAVLGLYPATHQGIVASISPVAIPVPQSGDLSAKLIKALRERYRVFQLDATAYPGNSGSPMYDRESGEVVGIINKVFVKSTRESALANPSGITYAIPAKHVEALLQP